MSDNPISFEDLFDFSGNADIKRAIADIRKLKDTYKEFLEVVVNAQLSSLNTQQQALATSARDLANATRSVSITEAQHQKVLLENAKLMSELERANNQLSKTRERTRQIDQAAAGSVTQLTQKLKEQIIEYNALGSATVGERRKLEELANSINKTRAQVQSLTGAIRLNVTGATAARGSYNELDQQTKALVLRLKNLDGAFGANKREAAALQKQIFENTKRLKEFDSAMNHNFRNVGNYKSALAGVRSQLLGLAAGYLSIQGAIGLVTATYDTALQTDSTRTALEFIFKSASVADEKLRVLGITADRLGLNFLTLTDSYKSFMGAAIASNFPLEDAERIFNSVSNAGSKMKLTTDQMSGALLALQQMISKGNVQAEELRGQLSERLPGAFSYAAQAMGVTEQKLNDMLKAGEVLASDLLPKLADQLDKAFGADKNEQVVTLSGEVNKLKNTFSELVSEEQGIGSFFTRVISMIGGVAKTIQRTISSTGWNEFFARLTNNKTADLIREINESRSGAAAATKSSTKMDLNNVNDQQIKAQYDNVANAYDRARKALELYKKGVKDGTLKESEGAGSIASMAKQTDFLYSKMNQLRILLPKAKNEIKNVYSDIDLSSIDAIQKRITELKKTAGSAIKGSAIYNEMRDLQAKLKSLTASGRQGKSDEQIERDAIASQNKIFEAGKKYRIAAAELEYSQSKQTTQDQINLEEKKLAIIKDTIGNQLKIYHGRKEEIHKLLAEELDAEADTQAKVTKLRTEEVKKQTAAIIAAYKAYDDLSGAAYEGDLNVKVANKQIAPQERDDLLHEYRKGQLEQQLQQEKDVFETMAKFDEDYYNKKKEIFQLEKLLIEENSAYEIQKAEEVQQRKQEILEANLELATDMGNALFDIGAGFNEANIADLEHRKDRELELAGDNADAKKKIEENFNRDILAKKRKQALFDKLQALFNIGLNTAIAVSKATAESPLTFGLPWSAYALAQGAIQAAVVLAKPLPKYYTGREPGKKELAVVNDRFGPEMIENTRTGKFRFENRGEEGVTLLNPEDRVHTAHQTAQKLFQDFEDNKMANDFVNSLISGTGIMIQKESAMNEKIVGAIISSKLDPRVLALYVKEAISELPLEQNLFDERGFSRFIVSRNSKIQDQNARNKTGGNG